MYSEFQVCLGYRMRPSLNLTPPLGKRRPRIQISGIWWLPGIGFFDFILLGFCQLLGSVGLWLMFFHEFRGFSVIIPLNSTSVPSLSSPVTLRTSACDPVPPSHWLLGSRASSVCVLCADWSDFELYWPVWGLLFSPRLSLLFHGAHRARFSNFSYCIILVLRCPFGVFS